MVLEKPPKALSADALRSVTACPDCDLLLQKRLLAQGSKAICPRCSCTLYSNKPNSVDRSLAFAISGLILFFPANLYPILTLDFKGRFQDSAVITGVMEMYRSGIGGVATLILFCAIIIPLMKLLVITFVLTCVRFGFKPRGLISLFRFYLAISVWGMLEIFLLAILLSCLKLVDDADILFRGGFYAFIGLMVCSMMIAATLDEGHLWHRLDKSLYE